MRLEIRMGSGLEAPGPAGCALGCVLDAQDPLTSMVAVLAAQFGSSNWMISREDGEEPLRGFVAEATTLSGLVEMDGGVFISFVDVMLDESASEQFTGVDPGAEGGIAAAIVDGWKGGDILAFVSCGGAYGFSVELSSRMRAWRDEGAAAGCAQSLGGPGSV